MRHRPCRAGAPVSPRWRVHHVRTHGGWVDARQIVLPTSNRRPSGMPRSAWFSVARGDRQFAFSGLHDDLAIDTLDYRQVARIANIDESPPSPPLTFDSLMETWNAIQAYSERPLLRYMSTDEYAVECVCSFLRWVLTDDASLSPGVHLVPYEDGALAKIWLDP